jgi:hypothetical protein
MGNFFLVQIQHKKDGTWTKGVVVKDSLEAARQSFHAYLGAYGYGQVSSVDYVACYIISMTGSITDAIVDNRIEIPDPEPTM